MDECRGLKAHHCITGGNAPGSNMMRMYLFDYVGRWGWLLGLVSLVWLGACTADSPPTPSPAIPLTEPSPTPPPLVWPAQLVVPAESVGVLISAEGVRGVVRGELPSPCYTAQPIAASRQGSNFNLQWRAIQTADSPPCLPQPQPITAEFELDDSELPDGFYAVRVNDGQAQTSFTFQAALLNETTNSAFTMQVAGRVWHDECPVRPDQTAAPLPPGCQTQPNGQIRANGVLDVVEAGLEHVVVGLGVGTCPTLAVAYATTAQDGRFTFDSLAKGTYCVFVEEAAGSNRLLLWPGQWTTPSAVTVRPESGEVQLGWDYDLLPRPITAELCEDKGLFVADVTYADGTAVAGGSTITKTWRVENVGTCTWTTDYKLVQVGSGPEGQFLPRPIVPGDVAELSAVITVPSRAGVYGVEWLLQNEQGQNFGLGIAVPRPLSLSVLVE